MQGEFFNNCLPAREQTLDQYRILRNMCLGRIARAIKTSAQAPTQLQEAYDNGFCNVAISPRLIWETYRPQMNLDTIAQLLRGSSQGTQFQANPYPTWIEELMSNQNQVVAAEADASDCLGHFVGCASSQETRFTKALQVLTQMAPDYAHTTQTFVRLIILVGGSGFWSSSVPRAHGAIFVNPKDDWTLSHYIETLVHETAHLDLAIRQMLDPLALNPKAVVYSSLRHNPRPLMGVYHAMFVLVRTCSILKLFSGSHLCDDKQVTTELFDKFKGHLAHARNELAREAEFTANGRILFDSMCSVSDEILA